MHVWNVYTFSSRQVFELTKPPDTPILIPVLFVCIVPVLILWVLLPIFYLIVGVNAMAGSYIPAELVEFKFSSIPYLVLFVPVTIVGLFVCVVLLGTYFFIIGRCFHIDILWEHWLGFTAWINIPMLLTVVGSSLLSVWGHATNPSLFFFFSIIVIFIILPLVWTVVLCVQGLRIWTDKGMSFCVRISLIPYFLYAVSTIPELIHLGTGAL